MKKLMATDDLQWYYQFTWSFGQGS